MNHYPSFKYKEMNSIMPNNKTIKGIINIRTLSKITKNKKNIKKIIVMIIKYFNHNLYSTVNRQ